jgi:hypothetical protein
MIVQTGGILERLMASTRGKYTKSPAAMLHPSPHDKPSTNKIKALPAKATDKQLPIHSIRPTGFDKIN